MSDENYVEEETKDNATLEFLVKILIWALKAVGDWVPDKKVDFAAKLLLAAYPLVDGFLENYCDETANPYDDELVDQLKATMEEILEKWGFTPPNVDED